MEEPNAARSAWTYVQRTGQLVDPAGRLAGTGYSGHGPGLNNPGAQELRGLGPIPKGRYTVSAPYDHPMLGPVVMRLDAQEGVETFGRSLFRIHGDNPRMNHTASDGCVILSRSLRELIAVSPVRELLVVALCPLTGDDTVTKRLPLR